MPALPVLLFTFGLVVAGTFDVMSRRVPNYLTVPLFLGGLVHQISQAGWRGMGWGLAGGAVGLLLLILPFALRWFGAGDVKLAVAIGCWLGPHDGAVATALGVGIGGGLALVMWGLARPAVRRDVLLNMQRLVTHKDLPPVAPRGRTESVPLAVALGLGAAWVAFFPGAIHV